MRRLLAFLMLLGWLPGGGLAGAPGETSGETPTEEAANALYDQYSLQARAEADIGNDYLQVAMVIELEQSEVAALARRIDEDVRWAREQLTQFPSLQHETRHYSTWPIYRADRISGWRSSQTLLVGGSDFVSLRRAVGLLQNRLQLRSMQFRPRADTRREVEDELINRALENFKHRAQIVQHNMGASGYRVMHLAIDTGHHNSPPLGRDATRVGGPAPRSPDAGQSRMTVSVRGQIQLQQ